MTAAEVRWQVARATIVMSVIAGLAMLVLAGGVLSFALLAGDGRAATAGVWWVIRLAGFALLANISGWVMLTTSTAPAREASAAGDRVVIVEAPSGAGFPREYAHACFEDCVARGETPEVRHHQDRRMGVSSGGAVTVVYVDLGITAVMRAGVELAGLEGRPLELRQLPGWPGAIR